MSAAAAMHSALHALPRKHAPTTPASEPSPIESLPQEILLEIADRLPALWDRVNYARAVRVTLRSCDSALHLRAHAFPDSPRCSTRACCPPCTPTSSSTARGNA